MIDIRDHGGRYGGKAEPQYTFERKHPTIDVRTAGTASQYSNGSNNTCQCFMQRHSDFQAHLINNNPYIFLFSHDFFKSIITVNSNPIQVFVTKEKDLLVSYNDSRLWNYFLASENYATARTVANTNMNFGWVSYVFEYDNLIILMSYGNTKKVMAINKNTWQVAWYNDYAQIATDIKAAFARGQYLFIVSSQKIFHKIDMLTGVLVATYTMNTSGLNLIPGNIGGYDGQYFYIVGRSGTAYNNTPHKLHKFDQAGNLVDTLTFDYSNLGVNVNCGTGYTLDFIKDKYLIFNTGYDVYGSTILVVDITTAKVVTGWQSYNGNFYLFPLGGNNVLVSGVGFCKNNLVNSSTWFKWGEV